MLTEQAWEAESNRWWPLPLLLHFPALKPSTNKSQMMLLQSTCSTQQSGRRQPRSSCDAQPQGALSEDPQETLGVGRSKPVLGSHSAGRSWPALSPDAGSRMGWAKFGNCSLCEAQATSVWPYRFLARCWFWLPGPHAHSRTLQSTGDSLSCCPMGRSVDWSPGWH